MHLQHLFPSLRRFPRQVEARGGGCVCVGGLFPGLGAGSGARLPPPRTRSLLPGPERDAPGSYFSLARPEPALRLLDPCIISKHPPPFFFPFLSRSAIVASPGNAELRSAPGPGCPGDPRALQAPRPPFCRHPPPPPRRRHRGGIPPAAAAAEAGSSAGAARGCSQPVPCLPRKSRLGSRAACGARFKGSGFRGL